MDRRRRTTDGHQHRRRGLQQLPDHPIGPVWPHAHLSRRIAVQHQRVLELTMSRTIECVGWMGLIAAGVASAMLACGSTQGSEETSGVETSAITGGKYPNEAAFRTHCRNTPGCDPNKPDKTEPLTAPAQNGRCREGWDSI